MWVEGSDCCLPPEDPCTTSNCTFLSNEMSDFEISTSWTQVVAATGAAGNGVYAVNNVPDTAVGNDAPSRRMTLVTNTPTTTTDNVYVVCWKKSSSHNPSTQCAVTTITFCVESKRVSESDGQVRFFIKQNGSTYVTRTGFSIGVNWKRATGTFSQSDFEELSSGAQPNFTASGTAIEFGFGLKIPVNSGDEPFADVWFDNLCVVVNKNCTTQTCASGPCDQLIGSGFSPGVLNQCAISGTAANSALGHYSVTASSSPAGNPGDCVLVDFDFSDPWNQGGDYFTAGAVVSLGVTISPPSGQGCASISGFSVCADVRTAIEPWTALPTGNNWMVPGLTRFQIVAIQGGVKFTYAGLGGVIYANTSGWHMASSVARDDYVETTFSTTPAGRCSTTTNPSSRLDLSQPFTLGVYLEIPSFLYSSGLGGQTFHKMKNVKVFFDNICVKATYSTCRINKTPTVSLNGLSVSATGSHPWCNPASVAFINGILASSFSLAYRDSGCFQYYTSSILTGPFVGSVAHRVSLSVSLTRNNTTNTVTGQVTVDDCVVGSGGSGCTILKAVFGGTANNGDCDNGESLPYTAVNGNNSALCLEWSPAGSSMDVSYA